MVFQKSEKLLSKTSKLIKRNGKFILEIGFNQKNRVKEILKKEGFYVLTKSLKRLWK